jgi:hypothetical protein
MTVMIGWVGRDTHAPPASAYIATDSRITWGARAWDFGRKTYASRTTADIFGYCGDVLFPSLALSQFVSALDEDLYPPDFESRRAGLERLLRVSFQAVPLQEQRPFTILHFGREADKMDSQFYAATFGWRNGNWTTAQPTLPSERSAVVHIDGSGTPALRTAISAIVPAACGTTRALFTTFVQVLGEGTDPLSGGAPQLVGLYRIGCGRSFGILHRGRHYLYGMPVHDLARDSELAWRNDVFELASGITRSRLPGAKSHQR